MDGWIVLIVQPIRISFVEVCNTMWDFQLTKKQLLFLTNNLPIFVQGEVWMCITIRFPILTGLKMPEDEVIDIKCKPQDPAIAGNNIINFQENV
jgi:hypothetical protein